MRNINMSKKLDFLMENYSELKFILKFNKDEYDPAMYEKHVHELNLCDIYLEPEIKSSKIRFDIQLDNNVTEYESIGITLTDNERNIYLLGVNYSALEFSSGNTVEMIIDVADINEKGFRIFF